MKTKDIINIVKTKGKRGCTNIERYIDLPDGIFENRLEVAQIVNFDDERGLAVCGIDDCDELQFIEYNNLSASTKRAIGKFLEPKKTRK